MVVVMIMAFDWGSVFSFVRNYGLLCTTNY